MMHKEENLLKNLLYLPRGELRCSFGSFASPAPNNPAVSLQSLQLHWCGSNRSHSDDSLGSCTHWDYSYSRYYSDAAQLRLQSDSCCDVLAQKDHCHGALDYTPTRHHFSGCQRRYRLLLCGPELHCTTAKCKQKISG